MSIRLDENNLKQGLLGLVVAVVEVIRDVLELEALRQIDSGVLSGDAAERLADALAEMADALEGIKDDHDLRQAVASVRDGLDRLVGDVVEPLVDPSRWVDEGSA